MIQVKILAPEDWQILRELRLAALKDSPEFFGGTYEEAASRSDDEWRQWPRVELNVYDNNPRAHAFYKRYGFVDVRRTDYGQPGVTMRLMDTPSEA